MEDQALTEKSSGTFLSGLSDCSNLTFRKVQRYWESNSAAHKEVCKSFDGHYYYINNNNGHHIRLLLLDDFQRNSSPKNEIAEFTLLE